MSDRYVRIVHELPEQVVLPAPRAPWKLELHELLALTANLEAAGYDAGPTLAKITAISDAVERAIVPDVRKYLTDDLVKLDPAEVAERVRQAGIDLATHLQMARAREDFNTQLALSAAAELRANSDHVVKVMRKTFNPAVRVVEAAAKAGITIATEQTELLDIAEPATIDAYRKLAPAVAILDGIARLRTQMCTLAGLGPANRPICCFIARAASSLDLESADNAWRGQLETVQHDLPFTGSHMATVTRPRLGGAWLALIVAGYTVRLNTADEAEAVLAMAS